MIRCDWANSSELMKKYHDTEWGIPIHDDRKLFEFLILEGAQAGLSWASVLKRREEYIKAFMSFRPEIVAKFDEKKINKLMSESGIIRNRLKILSSINNAKRFLKVAQEFGSFESYIWKFTNHKMISSNFDKISNIPVRTPESERMSEDLRKRGFSFVGPTICYAFMQATGMANDHLVKCFKKKN